MVKPLSIVADHGRVIVPTTAVPIRGDLCPFPVKRVSIPDGFEVAFLQGADAGVLLEAGVDIAPWINSYHEESGIAAVPGIGPRVPKTF